MVGRGRYLRAVYGGKAWYIWEGLRAIPHVRVVDAA